MPPPIRDVPRNPPPRGAVSGPPTSWAGRRPELRVQVELGPNSGVFIQPPDVIDWETVTVGLNETEETATLTIRGLDAGRLSRGNPTGNPLLGDQHFTHLLAMLGPNRRIRIGADFTSGDPLILFQGWPLTQAVRWSGNSQVMTVTCVSEADEFLAVHPLQQILGQVRRKRPDVAWNSDNPETTIIDALPLIFNPGGKPNMNPHPYGFVISGMTHLAHFPCDVSDPLVQEENGTRRPAKHWSVVNALRYLCVGQINSSPFTVDVADFMVDTDSLINTGPLQTGDPFADNLTARVSDLSCANMSSREALVLLCGAHGLHFHVPIVRGKSPSGGAAFSLRIFAALLDGQEELQTQDRRMIAPKVRDLPRQAPYTDNTGAEAKDFALANKAGFECDLAIDHRVINAPIIHGGVRHYECTLLLRPGWTPHGDLDNLAGMTEAQITAKVEVWRTQLEGEDEFRGNPTPTSPYHGQHPSHSAVSDVGRLWIFPDTLRYVGQGLERSGWDDRLYSPFMPVPGVGLIYEDSSLGGLIADSAGWIIRARPFRDTIARASKDSKRSPVVRISFDFAWNGDPTSGYSGYFRTYAGDVSIDTQRAALRLNPANFFTDAQLREDPSDPESKTMIEAIIRGTFAVTVTCCVEGDSRIKDAIPVGPSMRPRAAVVDVSTRFQHLRRRGQNSDLSTFVHAPDEAEYENREDDDALEDYTAKLRRRSGKETAAANVAMPWIDEEWLIGDACTGCSGIDVPFAAYSEITAKTYRKDVQGNHSTTYNISDLRHAPKIA